MMIKLNLAPILLSALAVGFSPLTASCTGGSAITLKEAGNHFAEKQEPARTKENVSIAAVGDIMLGSPFPNESRMPPGDGVNLLDPVAEILKSADIAFGNLEGPLADGGASTKCRPGSTKCFAFRMPTRYGQYLKDAGFDVMSVANNHAGDFGAAGRRTTRETLDKLGILHAGSDSGRYSTAVVTAKGLKVAFIGFATNAISLNVNNIAAAEAAVRQAEKMADIVVVSFHAGAEGSDAKRVPNRTEIFYGEKRGNLRQFSKAVIDAGADLVIGHGPHVLRGMEIYKDRLVAYSLGNFATYGWFRLEGDTAETLVLVTELAPDGAFLGGKIHPFRLEGRGLLVADDSRSAVGTIRNLSSLDFGEAAPKVSDDGVISR